METICILSLNYASLQRFEAGDPEARVSAADSLLYNTESKTWEQLPGGGMSHRELNSKSVVCGTVKSGDGGTGAVTKVVILASGRKTQDQVIITRGNSS